MMDNVTLNGIDAIFTTLYLDETFGVPYFVHSTPRRRLYPLPIYQHTHVLSTIGEIITNMFPCGS
jgi:hypothetical protein